MDTGNIYELPTKAKGGGTMGYDKSDLERAVELVQPQLPGRPGTMGDWFEELQKALVPLRYLQGQCLDQGDMDQISVTGYLNVFLTHTDALLAEAYLHGWTNHPQGKEK